MRLFVILKPGWFKTGVYFWKPRDRIHPAYQSPFYKVFLRKRKGKYANKLSHFEKSLKENERRQEEINSNLPHLRSKSEQNSMCTSKNNNDNNNNNK